MKTDKMENKKASEHQRASCDATPIRWTKVSSVTCGGKPYFYNTVTDDYYARRSVVWDRFEKAWTVKGPQTREDYHGKVYGTFATDKAARLFVEQGYASQLTRGQFKLAATT